MKPKLIYKFEDFTIRSLRNLKSQTIFFGSPKNFNDPYDCAIRAEVRSPKEDEINQLRNFFLCQSDLPNEAKNELSSMNNTQLSSLIERNARSLSERHADDFLNTKGVTCFSEINSDLLMWSHYGGKYKGFCLEFATEFEPFNKLRKVNYVDSMPVIDPISAIMGDNFDQFLDLYCTKSKSWSYEKEWRALHHVANTEFTYPTEALKGIYFGPDVDPADLEIACLVLQGQNPNVIFWRGRNVSMTLRHLVVLFSV
ncbi:MAG: DUF2971 domain-containing protein [Methylomicrobium sp.]|nr:DUF2971 domain-containing protein [Methylomicrobium sp.]